MALEIIRVPKINRNRNQLDFDIQNS